jgi:hypothetical protein
LLGAHFQVGGDACNVFTKKLRLGRQHTVVNHIAFPHDVIR